MSSNDNLQVRLRNHPKQRLVSSDDYIFEPCPIPTPGDGQILLRTVYQSIDAGSRAMLDPTGYVVNMKPGELVGSSLIGQVMESRHPDYAPGDYVHGHGRWARYLLLNPARLGARCYRIVPKAPLSAYLGMFGFTGFTAWIGMALIGKPEPSQTVVVSAAAGAVGLAACQMAKIMGARVVGIAGGTEKCALLSKEIGCDAVVDYKANGLDAQLDATCPNGIDVYFENVGGETQRAVLPRMNVFGRIPLCGQVAQYGDDAQQGPNWFVITLKRLLVQGFLAPDHMEHFAPFIAQVEAWHAEGRYRNYVTVTQGLENAADAVNSLVTGRNIGKQMIQIGPESLP